MDIRSEILKIFELVREVPGEKYEPESLMQYLVRQSKETSDIHNTFKGKGYLARFLREMELKFCICFSLKDWEQLYTLSQIESRVVYLLKTPRSSLASARNNIKQTPPINLVILVCALCLPVVIMAVKIFGMFGIIVALIPISASMYFYKIYYDDVKFYKNIESRIMANKAMLADA